MEIIEAMFTLRCMRISNRQGAVCALQTKAVYSKALQEWEIPPVEAVQPARYVNYLIPKYHHGKDFADPGCSTSP